MLLRHERCRLRGWDAWWSCPRSVGSITGTNAGRRSHPAGFSEPSGILLRVPLLLGRRALARRPVIRLLSLHAVHPEPAGPGESAAIVCKIRCAKRPDGFLGRHTSTSLTAARPPADLSVRRAPNHATRRRSSPSPAWQARYDRLTRKGNPYPFPKEAYGSRRLRRDCTRMSIASPSSSTARHRYCRRPWIFAKTSSRYQKSPMPPRRPRNGRA